MVLIEGFQCDFWDKEVSCVLISWVEIIKSVHTRGVPSMHTCILNGHVETMDYYCLLIALQIEDLQPEKPLQQQQKVYSVRGQPAVTFLQVS